MLRERGTPVAVLRPPAGEVPVRYDGELTLIAADPDWGPPFEFVEVGSPEEVDRLETGPTRDANVAVWAWLDEEAGLIRERVFVPGGGIVEDEATGSAALRLVDLLGRELEIRQGRGSVLHARPVEGGMAEVGGRVVLDEVRDRPAEACPRQESNLRRPE